MASIYARQLGETVKARRVQLGLTQQDLAEAIGKKHKAAVCRLEAGQSESVLPDLYVLAAALRVNVVDLLSGAAGKAAPPVSITCSVTCRDCGAVDSGLNAERARQVRADHIREHLAASP
jgi:transcriptional regulator with XRE-family HTH domain